MKLFTLSKPWQVFVVWIAFFFAISTSKAQCPRPSFTLPDTVCIGENITISNTSTGATLYSWDFCNGDLKKVPTYKLVTALPSLSSLALGITTVKDGANWYSFVTDFEYNTIIRLDYGNNLNNTPTINNLGNPGGLLSLPDQMKLIKIGNEWFGIVGDLTTSSSNTEDIVRLYFGDKLTNIPTASYITSLHGLLEIPRGLEIVNDNGEYISVILNHKSNTFTIVNFGNTLANNPTNDKIIVTSPVQDVPQGSGIMKVSIKRYCNKWIGVAASFNNKLFLLEFGERLFSSPRVTEITNASPFGTALTSVSLVVDESNIHAIVTQFDTQVIDFNFGQDIQNTPSIKRIFNFEATEIAGPDIVSENSETFFIGLRYTDKEVVKAVYSDCNASITSSELAIPSVISYSQSGWQKIMLTSTDNQNGVSYYTDSVFVRPLIDSDFKVSNQCVNQAVTFTAAGAVEGNTIVSYFWDFGDGQTSTQNPVQHIYATAKDYPVSLTLRDLCNKTYKTTKSVKIYQSSTADIELPTTSCSYQTLQFKDASTVIDDPIVKWEWKFSDNTTSTEQNPVHKFTSSGTQTVSLTITGQSGCQTNVIKSILLQEGANIAFSFSQACLGNKTQFVDETTFGSGTNLVSRSWDFGDNSTPSTEQNPSHTYSQIGTYLVTLTIENSTGCSVALTKSVTIYSLPTPVFSTALACAGEATQFTDESIANNGSIQQWDWNFGDSQSAENSSTSPNPIHAFTSAGTYQVKLKVTNSFGCIDSLTKSITVIASPVANFTAQSNCNTREVIFTNTSQPPSGGSIISWYWDFGDNSTPSTEQNPSHTYSQIGTYTVQLTVTSASRCTNTLTKTVAAGGVGISISPDTTVCANTTVVFKSDIISTNDPVTTWRWNFGTLGEFVVEQPSITIPKTLTSLTVNLTVTTSSGCTSSLSKTIPVLPSSNSIFTYNQSSTDPLTISFINQSTNASQYVWDFGDNIKSTEMSPIHTYSQPGIYEVILTSFHQNGCEAVVTQKIPLNISTINNLLIFPNPISKDLLSNVKVGFSLSEKRPVYFEIYTTTGALIQKTTLTNTQINFNAFTLLEIFPSLSVTNKGMYLLILRYGDSVQVQKFIVQ
ncbi:PKD domain-containing protein [Xanthocytophaga agilis]|uniref:PKD domain-containing protein n=1 Tax=Xanthocytophaga agilis TaxID=3048010 RepID=A0AAE3R748_9BACT|nr:PKD domain-containing protein [Xanthocytophaga agilis]MDJ1502660.1 PKD domain-containing protein [Xanthocytophaga agilis]